MMAARRFMCRGFKTILTTRASALPRKLPGTGGWLGLTITLWPLPNQISAARARAGRVYWGKTRPSQALRRAELILCRAKQFSPGRQCDYATRLAVKRITLGAVGPDFHYRV